MRYRIQKGAWIMRLVTRSDFDGIVCCVLLEEAGITNSRLYCHPKDLQDGKIPITKDDVLANVPYVEGCGLWFDHHKSNIAHAPKDFKGKAYLAPSAARIIWDYYGSEEKFGCEYQPLMRDVDKVDSASLTKEDILNPCGWVMLGFIIDPRTGLGHHHHFRISNYQLMQDMVGLIRTKNLEEILEYPDVYDRFTFYYQKVSESISIIQENCRKVGKTVIFETRYIDHMPVGNRFLIYGLYSECDTSIQIGWGKNKEKVFIAVGKSILDRSNNTDISAILSVYGGGGHNNVGTCQVELDQVDAVIQDITAKLNQ